MFFRPHKCKIIYKTEHPVKVKVDAAQSLRNLIIVPPPLSTNVSCLSLRCQLSNKCPQRNKYNQNIVILVWQSTDKLRFSWNSKFFCPNWCFQHERETRNFLNYILDCDFFLCDSTLKQLHFVKTMVTDTLMSNTWKTPFTPFIFLQFKVSGQGKHYIS